MNFGSYSIDIDQIISIIQKHKFSHVLLHLPDGLKFYFEDLHSEITKRISVDISFSGDSCYGACDFPCLEELSSLGVQAVFQLGHTPIPSIKKKKYSIPIFFIPVLATYRIVHLYSKIKKLLIGTDIKIVTTAQHLNLLDDVVAYLSSQGFNPIVSKGDQRIFSSGQILGCNYSSIYNEPKLYDSILFIGNGLFHPIGLLLSTNKPVIVADPYSGEIKRDELLKEKEDLLKRRYATIGVAKNCAIYGILISTKPGQQQIKKAKKCIDILSKYQKKIYVFIMNQITPLALENFPQIDCFVSTACPRIAIDDMKQYKKPIITFRELQIAFGIQTYESYQFDEITE